MTLLRTAAATIGGAIAFAGILVAAVLIVGLPLALLIRSVLWLTGR